MDSACTSSSASHPEPPPPSPDLTCQVDFLEKYNGIVENHARRTRAGREDDDSGEGAATWAGRVAEAGADSAPSPPLETAHTETAPTEAAPAETAPPVSAASAGQPEGGGARQARRGWLPSRLMLEGTHVAGYTWRETDAEVEVYFPLPAGATKPLVDCAIAPRRVSIRLDGSPLPLLEGELVGQVDLDGSAWIFEQTEAGEPQLTLTLAKRAPDMWGYVLASDREDARETAPPRSPDVDEEPVASSLQSPGVDFL